MTNVYNTPDSNLAQADTEYEYVGFWMRLAASMRASKDFMTRLPVRWW